MFFPVDDFIRRRAKAPHELAMVNLLLINLLMLIALLAGSFLPKDSPLTPYKWLGVWVPLLLSLSIIAYSFLRAAQTRAREPWFVAAHWKLAVGRYQTLLLAYGLGIGLIGLDRLLSLSQKSQGMQELLFLALQRVALAPILIALMVLIMLESGGLYQASRGEVPDGLVKRFPPPEDLPRAPNPISAANPGAQA